MTRVSLLDGSHLQPWRQNIRHQSHCGLWFKAGIRVTHGAECLDSLAERFISEQKCLWHVFWRWRLQYRLSSDSSHFTQFSAGELWDRIFSYVRNVFTFHFRLATYNIIIWKSFYTQKLFAVFTVLLNIQVAFRVFDCIASYGRLVVGGWDTILSESAFLNL